MIYACWKFWCCVAECSEIPIKLHVTYILEPLTSQHAAAHQPKLLCKNPVVHWVMYDIVLVPTYVSTGHRHWPNRFLRCLYPYLLRNARRVSRASRWAFYSLKWACTEYWRRQRKYDQYSTCRDQSHMSLRKNKKNISARVNCDRVSPERGPKRSNTLSTQSSLPTPLTHSSKVGSRLGINPAFNIRQDQDTFSPLSGSEAQVQRTLTMVESSILPNLYNTDRNLLMLLNHEAIQKLIPT